jgi:DNA-binding transcriptional regulator YhcF (GntR family)
LGRYIEGVRFVVDQTEATPPYAQLREQIRAAIRTGDLPVGTRLPTIRRLAGTAGVAPGTVARAYRELEAGGLIDTRGRHGTFVSNPADDQTLHRQQLSALARAYARTAARYGVQPAVALGLIDQAMRDQE